MIDFHFETDFKLEDVSKYSDWAARIITTNKRKHSQIDYIFCDDNYLLDLNQKYLNHNTYTDIITFENASKFKVDFKDELLRVMSHGILHLMGYKDKSEEDSLLMRQKETECINMFHVEQ